MKKRYMKKRCMKKRCMKKRYMKKRYMKKRCMKKRCMKKRCMKKRYMKKPLWMMGCGLRQGDLVADRAVASATASGRTSSMTPNASMCPRFRSSPMRLTNAPSSVARQSGSLASTNALSCKLFSAALMWEMFGGSMTCVTVYAVR